MQRLLKNFPLLSLAAGWIGSIANQNRATIAGNIVNGSPAADAPPALLVYDAEIELISQRGSRRLPYANFHLGYKQSVLAPMSLCSRFISLGALPAHSIPSQSRHAQSDGDHQGRACRISTRGQWHRD
jgi:CO/xanthine dehydrogenase FAD-binding subunit